MSASDVIVARIERLPLTRLHGRVMTILAFGTFFDSYDALAIGSALTVIFAALHIDLVATSISSPPG